MEYSVKQTGNKHYTQFGLPEKNDEKQNLQLKPDRHKDTPKRKIKIGKSSSKCNISQKWSTHTYKLSQREIQYYHPRLLQLDACSC